MNLEKVIFKKDLIKDIKSISYLYESAVSPYKDYKLLKEESNKEFSFMLPEEKGEYNFQVDGIWDSTHNVSKIFKVYID